MTTTPEAMAFERGVRPVLQIILPDNAAALLKFRPPAELQDRIEALSRKSTDGALL